jgi:energy-coupling factor transport system ATP-binding protein
MMDKAIQIKNLSYSYKRSEVKVLRDINLDIERNSFTVIMGPSGAGKTTLCCTLNGLIPNFIKGNIEGEVIVNGKKVSEQRVADMAHEIALVFQDFESQLFSTNTELEIAFAPENFAVDPEEIGKRIKEALEVVQLKGLEKRAPATMSGGQKQRLVIASVLSMNPEMVVMDEPTTDLDPIGKNQVFTIAQKLRHSKDITQIIVEHETEEAIEADRVLLMNEGRIIKDGKPEEILRDINTMRELGLMPLATPDYFDKLGEKQLPLLPQEGAEYFKKVGYKISEEKYKELLEGDEKKKQIYGETIIKCQGLRKVYPNGFEALKGIDLDIKKGEFVAVVGQNGSGKTTMVKHFNGLLTPTSGELIVNDLNADETSIYELGKHVGYVFQNPDHQIFSDTVYDEVAFSPKARGFSDEEVEKRVKNALAAVNLEGYEEEDPFSLSKGERQRIAVASVLAAQPQVMIFDEPTTGLDYREQKSMMELIKKLNDKGHTIIIVTHTMWVVAEYADRMIVVKDGQIHVEGTTREVFGQEDKLADVALKAPHIVTLSNNLGKTCLTVEELLAITESNSK